MSSDYSDDESPEGVSFARGKRDALNTIKSVNEVLSRDKMAKKEKRRAIEQRNIEQKKRKTISLDILEEAEEILERRKALKHAMDEKQNANCSDDEDRSDEKYSRPRKEDQVFISISKTKRYNKPAKPEVADFKNDHLFNGRIRRINHNTMLLKRKIAKRR